MKIGFDNDKYLSMQSEHIRERIKKFDNKLYLEFGGKLFDDYHASRVLPGFQPDSKLQMLLQLKDQAEVVIVISAEDIISNKIRGDYGITYDLDVLRLIDAFQEVGLYVGSVYLDMTAHENLEVQRLQRGIPGKGCIDNALALVGLKDTGKKKAKDFSLGMRQRLALAIALLGNPEFLVLDEPINGLDPTGIIELRNLLKRLNKERGITILISSHILTELHQLANRYGILHEGKLLQEITATELDKRCKKHLLLQVNDVAAASVLLESKLNTSNFSVMPDKSIHLYDYVENAGKVSALLSANNITIYQLAQSGDSLETYYTNLIGGCQND